MPTGNASGALLVAAPTMWLPQDVRGTRNAYHATYAALAAAGMLDKDEALAQMEQARADVAAGLPPAASLDEIAA